ncbi:MAG: hypothetical protein EA371_02610 [Gammaproteobacteria bacterium]|nr:MAG: hypothetical protein EA371_02610 [Gammaproteobacteria bacterium]
MAGAPLECGAGPRLRAWVLALHAFTALVLLVSGLPVGLMGGMLAAVVVSAWRAGRSRPRWVWENPAGWWLGSEADWEGPWQLGAGSRLGRHHVILELRRDSARRRCIISHERLAPEDWRRLRARLAHA